jgi:hypothetical protein
MPGPKPFRPLMESIAEILKALEGKPLPPHIDQGVVDKLRAHHKEYADCCCMDAQVVQDSAAK